MQYSMFLVGTEPYCVWEWDLHSRNLEFIDQIDPKYFEYLAKTHYANLDGEDSQRTAIALRTGYHHGLESFFALVCAALQAPDCVVGWFEKYKPSQLRDIVKTITYRTGEIENKLGLLDVSWEAISERINLFSYTDEKRLTETRQLFADLWTRFSNALLDDYNIRDYNRIKHGFRTQSGGFALRVGLEKERGVSPPPEEMQLLGSSKFGTSFFVAETLEGAPRAKKKDPHFRVRRCLLNWDPESMAHALNLVALSINNVLSFLKIHNGVDPKTVQFLRPEDGKYFEKPWEQTVGVLNCQFDLIVAEKDITRFSKKEILGRLAKFKKTG